MAYRYEATEKFWVDFYALDDSQKESVRRAWEIFRLSQLAGAPCSSKPRQLADAQVRDRPRKFVLLMCAPYTT